MITKLKTIFFENNKIIIIIDNNNNIWYKAKLICLALNYKQPKMAIINNVSKEDKIQLKDININFKVNQQPDSMYINHDGLISLSKTIKFNLFLKRLHNYILSCII